jgi:hypothetical protein
MRRIDCFIDWWRVLGRGEEREGEGERGERERGVRESRLGGVVCFLLFCSARKIK